MAVLTFQTDPWIAGPPDASEYGDPAWFRSGPDAGLFGPMAWTSAAERGFDWTDLDFFPKYLGLLTLSTATADGFTDDLRIYGDAASTVAFSGHDLAYLWPWAGATTSGLVGGTVTGFSGTIQGRGAFAITGLSVPVETLVALVHREDAQAVVDASDLLLADDDLIIGSNRNDALRGGLGDDTLLGGGGDDRLDGGAGHDTADMGGVGFRGAHVGASSGAWTVTSAAGTDTLSNIEAVAFADGRLVLDADHAAAQVVRLYAAALDRLPDQAGLAFWITAAQHGQSLSGLASAVLASSECRARFGDGADDGAFVDRLYRTVLGRGGDAEGQAFWTDALDRGTSRADALVAFAESAENKAATAATIRGGIWVQSEAAEEVARLYDTVLGRLPDAPGLVAWKAAIEEGRATLAEVADAFTASAEFQSRYGGLGDRAFADALYRNTLDRAPDQAGLDHWTAVLEAGTSRAAVVLAFCESGEHVALTAPEIQGGTGILFA
jgi:hypothetical protein